MHRLYSVSHSYFGFLLTKDKVSYLDDWFMIEYDRQTHRMLENAQYLFIEDPRNAQEVRKICQKAGRLVRSDLKKEENLVLEKELADIYALQAQTYAVDDYRLNVNFPQARDYLKKELELREKILSKEPGELNTLLYASALYNLGLALERINKSGQGPKERLQAMELFKQTLQKAKEKGLKDLEKLSLKQIFSKLAYEVDLNHYGYFEEPDLNKALEILEDWLIYARLFMENKEINRAGIFLFTLINTMQQAPELYQQAGQPEKIPAVLEQGVNWARELLKDEINHIEFWKEQDFQWAYKMWNQIEATARLYRALFKFYEQNGQKEKAREKLEQIEELAHSQELLKLRENIERKQNYLLAQAKMDRMAAIGYETLQENEKAETLYLEALENLKKSWKEKMTGFAKDEMKEVLSSLVSLYERTGQSKKAKEMEKQKKRILKHIEQIEDSEEYFYDDEAIEYALFDEDVEYLESSGEKAFDFDFD